MGKKEQTTVNLTEKAQAIKDDLAPVYGLKNILSAGLILLSKLSADHQKQIIKHANDLTPDVPVLANTLIQQVGRASGKKGKHRPAG